MLKRERKHADHFKISFKNEGTTMSKKICLICGHDKIAHYVYANGKTGCEKTCKRCIERSVEVSNPKRQGKLQGEDFLKCQKDSIIVPAPSVPLT